MEWEVACGGGVVAVVGEQEQATDLSVNKRKKAIPPPLDLSLPQCHGPQQASEPSEPSPSPKYADKSLPIRKRWHSWSPVPMNGQEDSSIMLPLYPPDSKTGLAGVDQQSTNNNTTSSSSPQQSSAANNNNNGNHHQQQQYHQLPSYSFATRGWDFIPVTTSSTTPPKANGHHAHHHPHLSHAHSGTNANGDLQTPTPFYTPNEPSPKFMNSPVFSYSNPDTALYQGPFSPIRASSLYPPPSSPFTNLSLNSPLLPIGLPSSHQVGTPTTTTNNNNNNHGSNNNSSSSSSSTTTCFNMIPSTLLSPAPSQASTNSLSYEDLHEKSQQPQQSINFFQPAWSIFLQGTKVRFVSGMNSMDWYPVDFLAQSGDSLGLKEEYSPHGLEVRKFIVTSSAKERIQVTFCPVGDPHHPTIEVNCEPGHPFMVDKKGWCAVKPDVFQEIYGIQCQPLECGDVCLNIASTRSSPNYIIPHQLHQVHHHQPFPLSNNNNNNSGNGLSSSISIKMEPQDDQKAVPISVLPQSHQLLHHIHHSSSVPTNLMLSSSNGIASNIIINSNNNPTRIGHVGRNPNKAFASPSAKKQKEGGSTKGKKNNNNNASNTNGENKGRRPMNGFLLFAKDKRPELIQQFPGKDNRSISVLLGEAWQNLAPEERNKYSMNAKARADEQKRIHPDCWKRKQRSQSINSSPQS